MARYRIGAFCLVLALCVARPAGADENEGQADLDQATALKLNANTLRDLSRVIDLCRGALTKGLNDDSTKLARQLLSATLMDRASQFIRAAEAREPDAQRIYLQRLALRDLNDAVAYDDRLAAAYQLIGELEAEPGGDRARGRKAADKALALAESDRQKADALRIRAKLAGDPKKALADLNEARKLAPKDQTVLRDRAELHQRQERHDKALADYQAAIELESDKRRLSQLHIRKAEVLRSLERADEALSYLNKAIELAPKSTEGYIARARLLALEDKMDQAIADASRAIELKPNNLGSLLLRARIYQFAGKIDEAMADVNRMLALRRGLVVAIEVRASLLAAKGRYDEAIADMQRVVEASPEDPERMIQLGNIYAAAKQPDKAIEVFSQVLSVDAKNADALRRRGDTYLSVGKHAEAIRDYEASLKIDANDSGVLNNLAWVLATSPFDEVRDGARAIELAKKAVDVTKFKKAHIISTLAAAYAETGDWEQAVAWSQKAYDMGKGEVKKQLKEELESFRKKKPWRELKDREKQQNGQKENEPDFSEAI